MAQRWYKEDGSDWQKGVSACVISRGSFAKMYWKFR